MYNAGEYVVCGSHGVCEVAAVGPMDMAGAFKDRLYYTLRPVYTQGSTVYTPVDNPKIVMRPVLTKKEATELIERIPQIDALWLADEKGREQAYKAAIKTCECTDLIKIIKTLYLRKESRLGDGKKVTSVDEKYLKIAEDLLYGELSIPLKMKKDSVVEYITELVDGRTELLL